MTFTGPPNVDRSDRSAWSRAVETRVGQLRDAVIATRNILDGAITTAKLAAGAVTASKLGAGAVTSPALAAAIPRGALGRATTTTTQSGISAATDLTGLSVTVTTEANRLIQVSWYDPNPTGTDVNDDFALQLKEGATLLQTAQFGIPAANDHNRAVRVSVLLTPTAASHTYKVTVTRTAGVGSIGFNRAADAVGYLLVEDIGAA